MEPAVEGPAKAEKRKPFLMRLQNQRCHQDCRTRQQYDQMILPLIQMSIRAGHGRMGLIRRVGYFVYPVHIDSNLCQGSAEALFQSPQCLVYRPIGKG